MRCSNPKRRCGLFDMPDGQYGSRSWNGQVINRPGSARKHFHCPSFHKSISGTVLVAVGSSFSCIGHHPDSFWLADKRVQDTERQGRSRLRQIRFCSAFMLPLSSKRNSWMWDGPISEGAISCPNRANSTMSCWFTMNSSLLQVLQNNNAASGLRYPIVHKSVQGAIGGGRRSPSVAFLRSRDAAALRERIGESSAGVQSRSQSAPFPGALDERNLG